VATEHKRPLWANVLATILGLYAVGIPFAGIYFQWQYAHEHDFSSSLFPGPAVALGKASIWPYYVARSVAGGEPETWTEAEKESVVHFTRSQQLSVAATREARTTLESGGTLTREDVVRLVAELKAALAEARAVKPEALAKVHPELPGAFQERYVRSLELVLDCIQARDVDGPARREADELLAKWDEWMKAHHKELRIPKDPRLPD